jgi:rubrerythrin
MEQEEVCYTREVALTKAIEIEQQSFTLYLRAYKLSHDRSARQLIRELAMEELEHKYLLEKAFFEETVALHDDKSENKPVMKLALFLHEKPLHENSSPQDVLIYAIHEEKRSVEFYEKMATQCEGAPMAPMFRRLHKDESGHLARLEDLYEKMYMAEM